MDMKKMMKQAQMMQKNMEAAQAEIASMETEAVSGGGMVKAKVNGNMELKELKIEKIIIDPEDPEMLEDMIIAAVNEAIREMSQKSNDRMSAVTGGMNIPGLM